MMESLKELEESVRNDLYKNSSKRETRAKLQILREVRALIEEHLYELKIHDKAKDISYVVFPADKWDLFVEAI